MEIDDQQASAFNAAVKYLEDLSNLMRLADKFSILYDFRNWYSVLRRIENRIDHKFNAGEKEQVDELNKIITDLMTEVNKVKSEKLRRDTSSTPYIKLMEFDNLLKRIMDKYALLMPKSEDPRFALRGR